MKLMIYIVLIPLMSLYYIGLSGQIDGRIYDIDSGELLIGVTILAPDSTVWISGIEGQFTINTTIPESDSIRLKFRYLGYQELDTVIHAPLSRELSIGMIATTKSLSEVLVLEDHAKHEGSLSSVHLNESYFEKINSGTLAKDL